MDRIEKMKQILAARENDSALQEAKNLLSKAERALQEASESLGLPFYTDVGGFIPQKFYDAVGGAPYEADEFIEEYNVPEEDIQVIHDFYDTFEDFVGMTEYSAGHWLPSRNC